MDSEGRAVDWSEDGQKIVVGLKNGNIVLFDTKLKNLFQLTTLFNGDNSWIEEVKISPNSKRVAIGGRGSTEIQIYQFFQNKLQLQANITGMSAPVVHIDWSIDADFIMVNALDYDLKFCNTLTQKI